MALLKFTRKPSPVLTDTAKTGALAGASIEVMPRTAEKIDDFSALLPRSTRVYVAHIDGTPIEDMVRTAAQLSAEGFEVMPHFPARSIPDAATLADWIARYQGEAGIRQGLILAGGRSEPAGEFSDSLQLLDSGLFDKAGFTHLHVAGHPEGNRDIDPDGGTAATDAALAWKRSFAEQTDAEMAIVTQFAFDMAPIAAWDAHLRAQGITMPVHLGLAGPAKLQTLIKFAIACGVGPSLKVLQKRAMDVTKLVLPYTPDAMVDDLVRYRAQTPESLISQVHLFPLGGIKSTATWLADQGVTTSARTTRGSAAL